VYSLASCRTLWAGYTLPRYGLEYTDRCENGGPVTGRPGGTDLPRTLEKTWPYEFESDVELDPCREHERSVRSEGQLMHDQRWSMSMSSMMMYLTP
jgi:hypothetical protein